MKRKDRIKATLEAILRILKTQGFEIEIDDLESSDDEYIWVTIERVRAVPLENADKERFLVRRRG